MQLATVINSDILLALIPDSIERLLLALVLVLVTSSPWAPVSPSQVHLSSPSLWPLSGPPIQPQLPGDEIYINQGKITTLIHAPKRRRVRSSHSSRGNAKLHPGAPGGRLHGSSQFSSAHGSGSRPRTTQARNLARTHARTLLLRCEKGRACLIVRLHLVVAGHGGGVAGGRGLRDIRGDGGGRGGRGTAAAVIVVRSAVGHVGLGWGRCVVAADEDVGYGCGLAILRDGFVVVVGFGVFCDDVPGVEEAGDLCWERG